jgi:hypothetical protein
MRAEIGFFLLSYPFRPGAQVPSVYQTGLQVRNKSHILAGWNKKTTGGHC